MKSSRATAEEEQQSRLQDKRRLVSSNTYMMIERLGVAYDLRGGALRLCLGAGGEEISGVEQNHHDFHYAVFFFSELKFAHEQESVNTYGVLKAAYNNNNAILGMSHQQGEGIIII